MPAAIIAWSTKISSDFKVQVMQEHQYCVSGEKKKIQIEFSYITDTHNSALDIQQLGNYM